LRDLVGGRFRRLLVLVDHGVAFPAADRDRRDFPRERAVVVRRERTGQRGQRELVLRFACERERRRALFGEGTHQAALVVRVLEAV